MIMNESIKTLLERRSVRSYKPEHITDEQMNTILEAGKYTPTGMGHQSVTFVVIKNKEIRDKLSAMNAAVLGSTSDPFYGAPDVIAVLADAEISGTWMEDGALAMGNLMNAAQAVGVSSCWIHRAGQVFDSAEGRAMADSWGVPAACKGIGFCILGYADGEIPDPKARKENFVITVE